LINNKQSYTFFDESSKSIGAGVNIRAPS